MHAEVRERAARLGMALAPAAALPELRDIDTVQAGLTIGAVPLPADPTVVRLHDIVQLCACTALLCHIRVEFVTWRMHLLREHWRGRLSRPCG